MKAWTTVLMHPDELHLLPVYTGHMSPLPSTAFWLENSSPSMYLPYRDETSAGDSLQAYQGAKEGMRDKTFCKDRSTKRMKDSPSRNIHQHPSFQTTPEQNSDPHEPSHCLQPLLKRLHELLFLFLFGAVPALILIQF